MHLCATLAFCTFSSGLLSAQQTLPPVPHATVTDISSANGSFTEPSIALDPSNPARIVAVYQGGVEVQGQGAAAYSRDAGRHFAVAQATALADWHVVGDVTVTFDNKGNAFWCYLVFDRLGTQSYWAHGATRNGIFVRKSADGGKTWGSGVAVKAFARNDEPGMQFEDEPRIFADFSPHSSSAGNLYVGWVEWQIDRSVILFSRSTDSGQTWSTPSRLDTHAGLPRDDNGSLGGFMLTISPDGAIYAVWADGNAIVLTESQDGGKSFSHPRSVIETAPPYFQVSGVSRSEGFPQVAYGHVAGRASGRLYVTWSDYRNGDVDVFISGSDDLGKTWSPALRVNNDAIHNGVDQFFQWMTVDPQTGILYVVFYDRRLDPDNRKLAITLARSDDGGRSFRNYAWTTSPWKPQDAFLGDYSWITAFNDRVYAAWTETITLGSHVHTKVRVGTADFSR